MQVLIYERAYARIQGTFERIPGATPLLMADDGTLSLHGAQVAPEIAYSIDDIDRAMRNAQDGQTVGIPVGPDSSGVIAEVLLTAIDRRVRFRHSNAAAFRLVDDYEFGVDSLAEAEALIASLQEELSHFELALNPVKTRIIDLRRRLRP